jgi:septal ring factor EnvC (AmiA/AmiB activator)
VKDKRITDEMLVTLENLTKLGQDMRMIKEVHVVLAQQVEQIKGVCEQLNRGMMKQAEMMGTFTKAASDNSEMIQVVGDEIRAMQADNNTYRNRLNELSARMGSVEKTVKDSFRRLAQAFSSVGLPAD